MAARWQLGRSPLHRQAHSSCAIERRTRRAVPMRHMPPTTVIRPTAQRHGRHLSVTRRLRPPAAGDTRRPSPTARHHDLHRPRLGHGGTTVGIVHRLDRVHVLDARARRRGHLFDRKCSASTQYSVTATFTDTDGDDEHGSTGGDGPVSAGGRPLTLTSTSGTYGTAADPDDQRGYGHRRGDLRARSHRATASGCTAHVEPPRAHAVRGSPPGHAMASQPVSSAPDRPPSPWPWRSRPPSSTTTRARS